MAETPNPNLRTAPSQSLLYQIRRKGDPMPDRFFDNPGKALLWGLFTVPELAPIPSDGVDLETFYKTSTSSIVREVRFPLQSAYVLSEYTATTPFQYAAAAGVTDELFATAQQKGVSFNAYYEVQGQSVLRSGLFSDFTSQNVAKQGENPNFKRYFQAIIRLYRLIQPGKGAPIETNMYRFAFPENAPLKHTFDHNINWETAWTYFITAISTTGEVDIPSLSNFFKTVSSTPVHANQIFNGGTTPGYSDCIENLSGFINSASSCFMDSALMCMFAFKNSPFFENMVEKPFNSPQDQVCNWDPEIDRKMRADIHAQLRVDVGQIMKGNRFVCSTLRTLLGAMCTQDATLTNLAVGPHDPFEMYGRLCNALSYYPIKYIESAYRASSQEGVDEYASTSQELDQVSLPSLSASDQAMTRLSWPWSWVAEYENVQSGDAFTWRKTMIEVVKADCIVAHIDRRYTHAFVPPSTQPLLFSTETTLIPEKGKEEEEAGSLKSMADILSQFQKPSSSSTPVIPLGGQPLFPFGLGPTNPAQVDETRVNPRKIEIDHQMNIGDMIYTLRAVVYSPQDGHYASFLKCGDGWFNYDDLDVRRVVARSPVDEEAVRGVIETRGVLFFYYPPFPEMSTTEYAQIEAAVSALSQPSMFRLPESPPGQEYGMPVARSSRFRRRGFYKQSKLLLETLRETDMFNWLCLQSYMTTPVINSLLFRVNGDWTKFDQTFGDVINTHYRVKKYSDPKDPYNIYNTFFKAMIVESAKVNKFLLDSTGGGVIESKEDLLRHYPDVKTFIEMEDKAKFTLEYALAIQSAILSIPKLINPIQSYRGYTPLNIPDTLTLDVENLEVGQEITNWGFMSVSLDSRVSAAFLKPALKCCMLKIKIPANMPAFLIQSDPSDPVFPESLAPFEGEQEILMPAGTVVRIIKKTGLKDYMRADGSKISIRTAYAEAIGYMEPVTPSLV